MAEVSLELKEIKKSFTEGEAVLDNISLEISKGEFITLLGSSGCGKTTTLRIIAGLEQPDAGSVWLDGREVTGLEPNQRDVNTVFQNYALFPHMNVAENIGYGLKLKKVPKSEIRKKVSQMLELVQLEGYEKRKPSELSGGQKQRVAIARALVNNPKVLLLDEPLGALDLQLRRAMQIELKHLQKKLGITFIYITHDQEEAINMSDRIAVMKDGEHGFVMLDIDELTGTIDSTFIPFASRKLYTIPVDITGCESTTDILERMRTETAGKGYPEKSLIKYELVGKIDVESEKDIDFLLHQFSHLFYFVKIKDSSEYLVDYAAFAKDKSLKGEFIRTVMGRADLPEEDKATVIHYGLQALAGEEILDA